MRLRYSSQSETTGVIRAEPSLSSITPLLWQNPNKDLALSTRHVYVQVYVTQYTIVGQNTLVLTCNITNLSHEFYPPRTYLTTSVTTVVKSSFLELSKE